MPPSEGRKKYTIVFRETDRHIDELVSTIESVLPNDLTHRPVIDDDCLGDIGVAFVDLTEAEARQLRDNPSIARIDEDRKGEVKGHCRGVAPCESSAGWNIRMVGAHKAWPVATGIGIRVAIFDSGVSPHFGLPGLQMEGGANFVEGTIDSDVNDLSVDYHGNKSAGIVAAYMPEWGIMGVAPGSQIYPIRVLDHKKEAEHGWVIKAMCWAAKENFQVASISLGSLPGDDAHTLAYDLAATFLLESNCVIVASAGNGGTLGGETTSVNRPACLPQVIAVAAVDGCRKLNTTSSFGPDSLGRAEGVELAAPGTKVPTAGRGRGCGIPGKPDFHENTSAACPHVAGAAALLKQRHPSWTVGDIRQCLIDTADEISPPPGYDVRTGFGLLNCEAAIRV